jgi:hypothetical protein
MRKRGMLLLSIALSMVPSVSWAQESLAYTTGHPCKNLPWLGLATQSGRYEVLLGDECEQIGADMNVLLNASDDSTGRSGRCNYPTVTRHAAWPEWHWMGNLACARNETGDCDVADA